MLRDGPFRLAMCWLIGLAGCASPPTRAITEQHPAPVVAPAPTPIKTAVSRPEPKPAATAGGHAALDRLKHQPEVQPAVHVRSPARAPSNIALGVKLALDAALGEPAVIQVEQQELADSPPDVPPAVPPAAGMTLEQLQQIALTHNPAIQEASAAVQKACGIREQVGLFPNPEIGYLGVQLGDAQTDQHAGFINQDFVLGHKLSLNEQVLDQDVQVQLWEVETQRYRVLTDIQLRFVEALTAQRRLRLTEEFMEVAEEAVRIAELRTEAMEASRVEVLQAEIQLNEVEVTRQRARIEFDAAWKQLAATAGVPDLPPSELIGDLNSNSGIRDWDVVSQNIIGSSPQLQAAYSRIQRARAKLARERAQPIPNLVTQVQGGSDHGTGSSFLNLQIGMPIPIFNRNSGNISAAYSEYVRSTQNARRLELSLKAELARVAQEFESAAVTVERYESQILPKARETLSLSQEAYEAGEFNFLQVLIARRTFFETNMAYVQSLSDLAQASATVDGLLLTGGLTETPDFTGDDGLRGHALSGQ